MDDLRQTRFATLYHNHLSAVAGYALRRTASADDAADAVAETFLIAWTKLDAVPLDPRARLWLYATARRVLANRRRSQSRRDRLVEELGRELGRLGGS